MEQFELNFDAGLTDQFPLFFDCIRASVYSCGKPFKNIAADLDMSSSHLSRMLNPADEGANFPFSRAHELMRITGDLRPLYWLVEALCASEEDRKRRVLSELEKLLPHLSALVTEKVA